MIVWKLSRFHDWTISVVNVSMVQNDVMRSRTRDAK